jgi:hypothetical protein
VVVSLGHAGAASQKWWWYQWYGFFVGKPIENNRIWHMVIWWYGFYGKPIEKTEYDIKTYKHPQYLFYVSTCFKHDVEQFLRKMGESWLLQLGFAGPSCYMDVHGWWSTAVVVKCEVCLLKPMIWRASNLATPKIRCLHQHSSKLGSPSHVSSH